MGEIFPSRIREAGIAGKSSPLHHFFPPLSLPLSSQYPRLLEQ